MVEEVDILGFEVYPRIFSKYPLNWEEIYNRHAPLAVEIGCGNGEFLVSWATSKPGWNFLGIDLSLASTERIQTRIYKHNLQNVRVVRDDARFILRELFANNYLHKVVMNFPDPWPKEKHRDRRIVIPDFVKSIAAVLKRDGIFELTTDQKWYADNAYRLFQDTSAFKLERVKEVTGKLISTKYERKWKREHRSIFRFRAIKQKNLKISRILESNEMPHMIISKKINEKNIIRLEGMEKIIAENVFKIKEVFVRPDRQAFLLRTITKDRDYTQKFFVLVAQHKDGTIIKIDTGFQPYRTPAVKMVIEEIGHLLQDV